MSIRLRQIALVTNKLAPVIDDLKSVFRLEICYIDPECLLVAISHVGQRTSNSGTIGAS
jgi:hypothetical protein